MSNLGPYQQNQTFDGLLQIPGGVTQQLQTVQDGTGENTALKVGYTNVQVGNVVDTSILQIPGGVTSSLQPVLDGNGNPTGLQLSSSGANVTTSNTFVASIGGGQIPNVVPRLISDGFGDIVNVKDFGAVGDGVTDDTSAINSALDYVRTWINTNISEVPKPAISLYFPSGIYNVTSVNATQLHSGWSIQGEGATLYGTMADVAILDMCGSYEGYVRISIQGNSSTPPRTGIQLSRLTSVGGSSNFFDRVRIRGSFTVASIHNVGGETTQYSSCVFYNQLSSSSAYVAIIDGKNYFGLVSLYVSSSLFPPSNTTVNISLNVFNECVFSRGDGANVGPAIWACNAKGLEFHRCYAASWDSTILTIYSATSGDTSANVHCDIHCEVGVSPGLQQCVLFTGPNATPIHEGFYFEDPNGPQATSAIMTADTGVTLVTLNSATVRIPFLTTHYPVNGLFYPAANFKFRGDIYWGSNQQWDPTQTSNVTGNIDVWSRNSQNYGLGSYWINDYNSGGKDYAFKGTFIVYGSNASGIASGALSTSTRLTVNSQSITFTPASGVTSNQAVNFVSPTTGLAAGTFTYAPITEEIIVSSAAPAFRISSSGVTTFKNSFVFYNAASAPTSPSLGQTYYDTGTNKAYCWNGTSWNALF